MSDPTGPVSEVRAPIVASVWQLQAEVGQGVSVGDTVAVLESMKMEIPVHAEASGTVTAIPVELGQIVQEGDVIVVITGNPEA